MSSRMSDRSAAKPNTRERIQCWDTIGVRQACPGGYSDCYCSANQDCRAWVCHEMPLCNIEMRGHKHQGGVFRDLTQYGAATTCKGFVLSTQVSKHGVPEAQLLSCAANWLPVQAQTSTHTHLQHRQVQIPDTVQTLHTNQYSSCDMSWHNNTLTQDDRACSGWCCM